MKALVQIVQGDAHQIFFKIIRNGVSIDPTLIDSVYFTCKKLGVQKTAEYVENGRYKIELTPTETMSYKPDKYDFDITLKFIDSNIKTGIYEGNLIIYTKHNEVDYD